MSPVSFRRLLADAQTLGEFTTITAAPSPPLGPPLTLPPQWEQRCQRAPLPPPHAHLPHPPPPLAFHILQPLFPVSSQFAILGLFFATRHNGAIDFVHCFCFFFLRFLSPSLEKPANSRLHRAPAKAGGAEATCHHGDSSSRFMPEQSLLKPRDEGALQKGGVGRGAWRRGIFVHDPQPAPVPMPLKWVRNWPNRWWKPDLSPKAIFKKGRSPNPDILVLTAGAGALNLWGRGVNKLRRGSLSDEVSKRC